MANLIRKFLDHCEANNPDGVRSCLSRGVDINAVSQDGRWSGLTIVAHMNHTELLEILLTHPDIKINKPTESLIRLHHCQKIVKGGKFTALMTACDAGNPAIVSRLVEVPGLDINYQNERGQTAAHRASLGETRCVRILAETGKVDWNIRDEHDNTPLYQALVKGYSDIVEIIVKQPNIDYTVKNKGGYTLAHAAVTGGNLKCIKTLASAKVLI